MAEPPPAIQRREARRRSGSARGVLFEEVEALSAAQRLRSGDPLGEAAASQRAVSRRPTVLRCGGERGRVRRVAVGLVETAAEGGVPAEEGVATRGGGGVYHRLESHWEGGR